jgi:hypothetical protein
MPGISPKIVTHQLRVDLVAHPVRQKKRSFRGDRLMAITHEVDKLSRS